MVFGSGNGQYRAIHEVYHGKINDVVVCRDLQAAGTLHKTVWIVKDREVVRSIIQMFCSSESKYEECFGLGEGMCFVFPYEQDRSLDKFYLASAQSSACTRGQIWTQLIMKCMTSGLPAPILCLILSARQIRLGQDGNIGFQFNLNLEMLDESKTETDCVNECAALLRELMDKESSQKVAGELLDRRLKRRGYEQFIDLYKDIRLIARQSEEKKKRKGIRKLLAENRDLIYRVVYKTAAVLLVITVIMLLCRLIFGDTAIFQLFRHSLAQIGTESLRQ